MDLSIEPLNLNDQVANGNEHDQFPENAFTNQSHEIPPSDTSRPELQDKSETLSIQRGPIIKNLIHNLEKSHKISTPNFIKIGHVNSQVSRPNSPSSSFPNPKSLSEIMGHNHLLKNQAQAQLISNSLGLDLDNLKGFRSEQIKEQREALYEGVALI